MPSAQTLLRPFTSSLSSLIDLSHFPFYPFLSCSSCLPLPSPLLSPLFHQFHEALECAYPQRGQGHLTHLVTQEETAAERARRQARKQASLTTATEQSEGLLKATSDMLTAVEQRLIDVQSLVEEDKTTWDDVWGAREAYR